MIIIEYWRKKYKKENIEKINEKLKINKSKKRSINNKIKNIITMK